MDFFTEIRRLSATDRCFERLERRRFCRRIFSMAWVLAVVLPSRMDSSCSQSSRRARKRLSSRDRSIWHLMQTPLGRCLRNTQLEVLLIFWPPAPEPRTNFSNKSASVMPRAARRCSSAVSFSEVTGFCTDYALICLSGFRGHGSPLITRGIRSMDWWRWPAQTSPAGRPRRLHARPALPA